MPNLQNALNNASKWKMADRVGVCGKYLALECGGCHGRDRVKVQCGFRLCPKCAAARRWRTVQKYLPLIQTYKHPRFLTLTFINTPDLDFKWMGDCWRRFLKTWYIAPHREGRRKVGGKRFGDALGGGIRATEVTFGKDHAWHPHFHVIYDGEYIPKQAISRAWEKITRRRFTYRLPSGHPEKLLRARAGAVVHGQEVRDGYTYLDMEKGAFIVDVKDVDTHPKHAHLPPAGRREKALRELVKYLTKVADFVEDEDTTTEFIKACDGYRQIMPFGSSFAYKPAKPDPKDRRNWTVDPFSHRGLENVPCRCGDALWSVVGTMDRREANDFIRGSPKYEECPF